MQQHQQKDSGGGGGSPMSVMEENRHYLRAFIHTYRDLPVLWDTSLRDYTNREKRADAYEQLVPIYRYLKRDASVEDVKKKINTLRTNYRKELKVVENARRSGTMHQPRCWTIHELNFLRNAEKFLAVNPNFKTELFPAASSNASVFGDSPNNMQNSSFVDNSSYNFRALLNGSTTTHNNSSASVQETTPPSITDLFHKSFGGQTQKLEPHHTPPPQSPSTTVTTTSQSGDYLQSASTPHTPYQHQETAHKRQRLNAQGGGGGSGSGPIKVQNPEYLIDIACDYLATTYPEEDSVVRTWTYKLKRMPRDQRLLAEKFINDILFEGESGNLNRGSVQINVFEPYVRFEEAPATSASGVGGVPEEHLKSQSPSVHTSGAPLLSPEPAGKVHGSSTMMVGGGGGAGGGAAGGDTSLASDDGGGPQTRAVAFGAYH